MITFVNNSSIPIEILSYRDLGYRQPVKYVVGVKIQITKKMFCAMLESHYNLFIQETVNDAKGFGEWDPPWVEHIYKKPLIRFVEENKSLLNELVVEYLYFNILEEILPPPHSRKPIKYVINSINALIVEKEYVILECDAYPRA